MGYVNAVEPGPHINQVNRLEPDKSDRATNIGNDRNEVHTSNDFIGVGFSLK